MNNTLGEINKSPEYFLRLPKGIMAPKCVVNLNGKALAPKNPSLG